LSGQETSWVVLASTLTSHISRSSLLHVCLFVCSHTIGAMSPTRDVVLAFDTINHWTSCQDLHPVEHCASRRRSPRPTSPFSGGATLGEIEGHRPPAAWTTLTSVESLPPHTLVRESPPPPLSLLWHKRAMQQPGFAHHHSKACLLGRMCNLSIIRLSCAPSGQHSLSTSTAEPTAHRSDPITRVDDASAAAVSRSDDVGTAQPPRRVNNGAAATTGKRRGAKAKRMRVTAVVSAPPSVVSVSSISAISSSSAASLQQQDQHSAGGHDRYQSAAVVGAHSGSRATGGAAAPRSAERAAVVRVTEGGLAVPAPPHPPSSSSAAAANSIAGQRPSPSALKKTASTKTTHDGGSVVTTRSAKRNDDLAHRPPWTRFTTPRQWNQAPASDTASHPTTDDDDHNSNNSDATIGHHNDASAVRAEYSRKVVARSTEATAAAVAQPPLRWMPATRPPPSSPSPSSRHNHNKLSGDDRRADESKNNSHASVTRTPPRPVSDAWRRGDASSQASHHSRPSHVDDVEMLEVQVCQLSYLCTRAERAFAAQETEASAMIGAAARHLQAMKASAHDAAVELTSLEHSAQVETVVNATEEGVARLGALFPALKHHHDRLESVVGDTLNAMPTRGIKSSSSEDPADVERAITRCHAR
jgi:hypothetical protein